MEILLEKVQNTYAAIAALPEQSEHFNNLCWIEMLGGPYGGVFTNAHDICSQVFDRIQADWDDFVFTPTDFIEAGNSVFVIGSYTATARLSGKKLNARVIHLWWQEDETLCFEQFTDTMLLWSVLKQG